MKKLKMSKKSKTPKTPKCQINGTFWHFAKSEPPGWALFRFQGVPRDPILRPKTGYRILNVKIDIYDLHILSFLCFHELCIFTILCFSPICAFSCFAIFTPFAITIRPYGKFRCRGDSQERRMGVMCGGSPLWFYRSVCVLCWTRFSCRGDSQEREIICNSRSPLSEPEC